MKVRELIRLLKDAPSNEVCLATQPNRPLAFHVRGVAYPEDLAEDGDEDLADYGYVWIVEGRSTDEGYAPQEAFQVAVA